MELKKGYKQTEVGIIPQEWKLLSFGQVFNFLSTASYSRDKLTAIGDAGYIHYGDIHTKWNHFISLNKKAVPMISKNYVQGYAVIRKGDLIMADASEDTEGVGKSIEVLEESENDTISGLHTFLLRDKSNELINGFKGYIHSNEIVRKQFERLATGMKVFGISKLNLKKIKIPIPTKNEQSAIAAALSETDNLITNLEKMIAKKEAVKKGTMQMLLSGKKRLEGFSEKWQKRKISKLFRFLSTANNSRSELSDEGEIGYIHYGDIHTKWSEFLDVSKEIIPFIKKEKVKDIQFLENGDLLIADASEDYAGLCSCIELKNVNRRKIVAGLHTMLLRGNKEEIANGFKGYLPYLKGFKEAIIKAATGISVYSISKKNLGEIEITIPKTDEQLAIASVIVDMTTEIKQLEEKLQKYRMIKQSMMQQLLTGKIRLV